MGKGSWNSVRTGVISVDLEGKPARIMLFITEGVGKLLVLIRWNFYLACGRIQCLKL